MRIVSLLPSLTELVCALDRRHELVGVTHECDYPDGVHALPHLTRSRLPVASTSAEIHALVSEQAGSIYELDENLLAELSPDLILTQEQCDVCAVNELTVRRAARRLTHAAQVESVNPVTLDGVWTMFRRVGELVGNPERAAEIVTRFEATAHEIERRQKSAYPDARSSVPPRVILLEWLDPPFCSGHWNPAIIEFAGGREVLGRSGEKSRQVTWDDVARCCADVILVAPCGYPLGRTTAEIDRLTDRPEWRTLPAVRNGRVELIDGSAYFSRPGPRLETSLRIAAAAIDPAHCADLAPPDDRGRRRATPRTV